MNKTTGNYFKNESESDNYMTKQKDGYEVIDELILEKQKESWQERWNELIIRDLGTQKQRDWVYKQFITELLQTERDDVIRKFATGEFIKTPLAEEFAKQEREKILKIIEAKKEQVFNGENFYNDELVFNLLSEIQRTIQDNN